MRKTIASLAVFLAVAVSGCSLIPHTTKAGVQLSQEAVNAIQPGKTTKTDLVLQLGEPSKVLEDGKIWIYSGSKATAIAGFNLVGQKRLTVVFNEAGVVAKHSFKEE